MHCLHLYGFSPVWVFKRLFRCFAEGDPYSHWLHLFNLLSWLHLFTFIAFISTSFALKSYFSRSWSITNKKRMISALRLILALLISSGYWFFQFQNYHGFVWQKKRKVKGTSVWNIREFFFKNHPQDRNNCPKHSSFLHITFLQAINPCPFEGHEDVVDYKTPLW